MNSYLPVTVPYPIFIPFTTLSYFCIIWILLSYSLHFICPPLTNQVLGIAVTPYGLLNPVPIGSPSLSRYFIHSPRNRITCHHLVAAVFLQKSNNKKRASGRSRNGRTQYSFAGLNPRVFDWVLCLVRWP